MAGAIEAGRELPVPLHFFFYGTLIAGSDNAEARAVHDRLRAIGAAGAPGALWAIPDEAGWYPALVAGPGRQVRGVLYEAMAGFGAEDLARIDEWEDFRPDHPAGSLYLREAVHVPGPDGAMVAAQLYRFNQPLPPAALAIAEGDFPAWLTATGNTAYRG